MSRQASRGQMSTAYGSVLNVWGLTLTYAVEVRPSSNCFQDLSQVFQIFKGLSINVFCTFVFCVSERVCVCIMYACVHNYIMYLYSKRNWSSLRKSSFFNYILQIIISFTVKFYSWYHFVKLLQKNIVMGCYVRSIFFSEFKMSFQFFFDSQELQGALTLNYGASTSVSRFCRHFYCFLHSNNVYSPTLLNHYFSKQLSKVGLLFNLNLISRLHSIIQVIKVPDTRQ